MNLLVTPHNSIYLYSFIDNYCLNNIPSKDVLGNSGMSQVRIEEKKVWKKELTLVFVSWKFLEEYLG